MKKGFVLLCIASALLCGCGSASQNAAKTSESAEVTESVSEAVEAVSEASEAESEASSEFPFKITGPSAYRNDKTGNWYTAMYAGSEVMSEYAQEYYDDYFGSDSEIHFIWNASLGTVTRISVVGGELDVATYEYVEDEEHDAAQACTGQQYGEFYLNLETGETETIE